MKRLKADIAWQVEGPEGVRLDPRLLGLLRALQRHATLRAAAQDQSLSYRAAWGLLADAGVMAGAPLVELQRGRGGRLSRAGSTLLKHDAQLRREIAPLSERYAVPVAPDAAAAPALRLAASHDPLLAEFCERYAKPAGIIDEVMFRGSEESLAAYARGNADLAGFHFEQGTPAAQLRRYLKPGRDRLLRFAGREQGLLLAAGNPLRLHSLADVARRHARFVNRQKGSGTRSLTDRLLSAARIAPARLRGYEVEEYTHLAVAATIAAGHADAGIGVRAAAATFKLDFVPLAQEHYWLAVRGQALATAPVQGLMRALAGKPLSRLARGKPGYDTRGAGAEVQLEQAFA